MSDRIPTGRAGSNDPDADGGSWLVFELALFRHRPREWFLLTGDRLLVALLGLVGVAATFALAVGSGVVPLRQETPVLFVLFALIGANFTLIAIVTSLSQFVLGRRLEFPGEIREDVHETIAYRKDVGETIGRSVMPVTPDGFYLVLYRNALEELVVLDDARFEARTRWAREELDELVTGLKTHVEYVIDLLERPSSGMKHALFTSLSTDYENYAYRTWHLQTKHSDEFTEKTARPLANLVETLEHIEVASRLFKTVFIESEVSELSRFLLYVGLPVQILAVVVTLLYTAPGSGPPVPVSVLRLVLPAILTGGFVPFLILTSYVIRLTVVARRTADSFPFSS
jgi:hypothetical protein